jgi:hypothetical protein
MTCHQIWHIKWRNSEERSHPRVGRDIHTQGTGKKRRLSNGEQAEEQANEQQAEEYTNEEHAKEEQIMRELHELN